jgi:hypothetical protein
MQNKINSKSKGCPTRAAGVYNPITVAETSASLGGDFIAGSILEFVSGVGEVKLAYDAEILLLSYGVCLYSH